MDSGGEYAVIFQHGLWGGCLVLSITELDGDFCRGSSI